MLRFFTPILFLVPVALAGAQDLSSAIATNPTSGGAGAFPVLPLEVEILAMVRDQADVPAAIAHLSRAIDEAPTADVPARFRRARLLELRAMLRPIVQDYEAARTDLVEAIAVHERQRNPEAEAEARLLLAETRAWVGAFGTEADQYASLDALRDARRAIAEVPEDVRGTLTRVADETESQSLVDLALFVDADRAAAAAQGAPSCDAICQAVMLRRRIRIARHQGEAEEARAEEFSATDAVISGEVWREGPLSIHFLTSRLVMHPMYRRRVRQVLGEDLGAPGGGTPAPTRP